MPVVPKVLRAKVRVFVDLYRKTRQLEALNAELEQRVANRTAELAAQTERLRQSEERRSIALSAGDMGSWEVDVATGRIDWDAGSYRIFDVEPETFEPTVETVEAMLHPDDLPRAATSAITAASTAGGDPRFQTEFRVLRPNGEVRCGYSAGIISCDAQGKPVRLNGVNVDITERKRAEERQFLLAREVDHRAKNTLAVVLSVLRLTRAPTIEAFITAVEGRVHAMAATHNLLSSTRWEGADLRKIVEEEMAPYHATHRQRVITDGPAVVLLPATAQAMALALHELATNAAKYGALSTDAGILNARWRVRDDALVLDWIESGGPATAEPARLGFGLTIVRSSIEAQFRGGVSYDWRPEGLHCRLSIPAAQIVAAVPTPAAAVEAPADPGVRRSLAGKRLLVVEDELLVSMLLRTSSPIWAPTSPDPMGDWPMAWPRPRPSASTAPSSTSTWRDNWQNRWPTCCWRAASPSCSSPATSATASTAATPTCRCCPSRSMHRRWRTCCSPFSTASRRPRLRGVTFMWAGSRRFPAFR